MIDCYDDDDDDDDVGVDGRMDVDGWIDGDDVRCLPRCTLRFWDTRSLSLLPVPGLRSCFKILLSVGTFLATRGHTCHFESQ